MVLLPCGFPAQLLVLVTAFDGNTIPFFAVLRKGGGRKGLEVRGLYGRVVYNVGFGDSFSVTDPSHAQDDKMGWIRQGVMLSGAKHLMRGRRDRGD